MLRNLCAASIALFLLCSCDSGDGAGPNTQARKAPEAAKARLTVTSSAFKEGGEIPSKYTCDGANVSPSVAWKPTPKGARSFALICDDPDAPRGTWVHWVAFDIPPSVKGLPESVPPLPRLAVGGKHGTNDFRTLGYGGPCPPSGTHRYFFRVYALDRTLGLEPGITKARLVKAIEGHVIGEGRLMGRYARQ